MLKRTTYGDFLDKIENFTASPYAWTLFVITAAIIFSPFFLRFHIIISSTDNVFNHYPNILYGYRALRSGNFGLWNPYIFAGTDFTSSMHNHMLNPFNWIFLLFPEKYLFQAVTFKIFLEYVFIGILSFKIFQLYCEQTAAVWLALIAQLCTYTWFTTTTMIATDLLFFSLSFIYLILTAKNRRNITNFVLMSICAFGIFIIGHESYIATFELPIVAVFLVTYWKELRKPWRGITPIFIAANLVGFAMAAFRLIPIALALINDQAMQTLWPLTEPGNNSYFTLTGFIPEVFGQHLGESASLFHNVGVDGRHTQFHNLLYFGITPIFLILLAALGNFGKYAKLIALIGLAVAATQMFLIQPLSDIVSFLSMPFLQDITQRTLYPFLFLTALMLIIKNISASEVKINPTSLRALIMIVAFILAATITFFMKELANQASSISHWPAVFLLLRLLLIAEVISLGCLAWFLKMDSTSTRKITNYSFTILVIGMAAIVLALTLITKNHHTWYSTKIFLYSIGISLWALAMTKLLRIAQDPQKIKDPITKTTKIFFLICLIILILPMDSQPNTVVNLKTFFTAMFSILNFMVLAALSLEILQAFSEKKLSTSMLLIILIMFLFGELLFNVKLYSFVGAQNFSSTNDLYPQAPHTPQAADLNLKQYRVNNPDFLSKNPWGEPCSSIPMAYNIPTYGGVDSIVNHQLYTFVQSFSDPQTDSWLFRMGMKAIATNPRMLDLFGVKYDFDTKGNLIVRPNALARLSAFTNYQIAPDAKSQIQILNQAHFDPTKTVLLNKDPKWSARDKRLQRFYPVDFSSVNSSVINATLDLKHPTILLFDDSYSRFWQAKWNNKAIPVYLANGNFMAVSLPKGPGTLSLDFRPVLFLKLAYLSWGLGIVLLLLAIYTLLTALYRSPQKQFSAAPAENIDS